MRKFKLKLKKQFTEDLYEIYPNAFDIKDENVKINNNNKFIKLMKQNIEIQKEILNNLGVVYYGYTALLLNTLTYENQVDFGYLVEMGIKIGMVNKVKRKLLDCNIIKKQKLKFYLNPMVAIKGEVIDLDIINLFK